MNTRNPTWAEIWDKILLTFGWTQDEIDADKNINYFKEQSKIEHSLIYHDLPFYYVNWWIVPEDLKSYFEDNPKEKWEIEHIFEGREPDGTRSYAYLHDRDFDWQAAKKRVDDYFDEIRRKKDLSGCDGN